MKDMINNNEYSEMLQHEGNNIDKKSHGDRLTRSIGHYTWKKNLSQVNWPIGEHLKDFLHTCLHWIFKLAVWKI